MDRAEDADADGDGVIPDGIVPPYVQERLRTIRRSCPVCQAKPFEPCTIPTNTGREPVRWFHLARESDIDDQDEECPGEEKEET